MSRVLQRLAAPLCIGLLGLGLAPPSAAEPSAPNLEPAPILAVETLALPVAPALQLELDLSWIETAAMAASSEESASAGTEAARPPRRTGGARLRSVVERLPFEFRGGEVAYTPAGWGLRLGRGAMASTDTARADLSPTRAVASADVAGHGGNVAFTDDGPAVGDVFAGFGGLGHRPRVRLDLDLPTAPGTTLAAGFAGDGDADLAVFHRGRWHGLDLDVRAAAMLDDEAAGRAVRLAGSAALRAPASGLDLAFAVDAGGVTGGDRTPATAYAKLTRSSTSDGPIRHAFSLEAARARNGQERGDRAWLAGATAMQQLDGLGRLSLRYRYQALDGRAERGGAAHAVRFDLRLKL